MECLYTRIPYSSWRLQVFQQLFTSYTADSSISTRQFSSSSASASDQNDATSDQHQRPSQLLPQSPLTSLDQTNTKHRKSRPPPTDSNAITRNPWAIALASPIRMCTATRVRLPKAFLGEWGLVHRPAYDKDSAGNERLWFMPTDLLLDELSEATAQQQPQEDTGKPQLLKSPSSRQMRFLKLRIVNRMPILASMTVPLFRAGRGKKTAITRLIPHRWKYPFGPVTNRDEKKIVWREDMPGFVLGRLRVDVVMKVRKAVEGRTGGSGSKAWTVLELQEGGSEEEALLEGLSEVEGVERMGTGAVLVMGRDMDTLEQGGERLPEYVMLPQAQSKVPVFDLRVLLSEVEREALRALDEQFQASALFLRPDDTPTVDAVLTLWRLQSFLRERADE